MLYLKYINKNEDFQMCLIVLKIRRAKRNTFQNKTPKTMYFMFDVKTGYFCEPRTLEYEVLTLPHGNCSNLSWD